MFLIHEPHLKHLHCTYILKLYDIPLEGDISARDVRDQCRDGSACPLPRPPKPGLGKEKNVTKAGCKTKCAPEPTGYQDAPDQSYVSGSTLIAVSKLSPCLSVHIA